MRAKTADFILRKVLRWHPDDNFPKDGKALILGVPHTSIWDFVIAYLYAISKEAKIHILVKEQYFVWPFARMMRRWGAIPLKPQKGCGKGMAMQMVEAFNTHDEILFGMAPEGTRKPVKKWKTGFHTIARKAGVPVYAGYIDYAGKRVSYGEIFPLTDDVQADMIRLQQFYKDLGVQARHPEGFVFDDAVK